MIVDERAGNPVPGGGAHDAAAGGTWLRVVPALMRIELARELAWALLWAVITGVLLASGPAAPWAIAPACFLLISLVTALLTPRRLRAIGYRLERDELLFRRGILFSRLVALPYGRVQLVTVEQGPLLRLAGLAALSAVTASPLTRVTVPGLTMADALRLRDELIALAETRRVGA